LGFWVEEWEGGSKGRRRKTKEGDRAARDPLSQMGKAEQGLGCKRKEKKRKWAAVWPALHRGYAQTGREKRGKERKRGRQVGFGLITSWAWPREEEGAREEEKMMHRPRFGLKERYKGKREIELSILGPCLASSFFPLSFGPIPYLSSLFISFLCFLSIPTEETNTY